MSMKLERLESPGRADGVFEQLRARILGGDFPAGTQLPTERDLAEALGVNRSSVREAVKRLQALELVEVRHGQGTFTCEVGASSSLQVIEGLLREPRTVTRDLLAQLLEFRRHALTHVVELAAQRRSDVHLERARALLERERERGTDPGEALAIDLELNALLGEASGNLLYQLVSNLFSKLVLRLGPLYYNEGRDHRRSLETHRELLAALEGGDAGRARRLIEVMLGYSEATILAAAERLEAEGRIGPGARPPELAA